MEGRSHGATVAADELTERFEEYRRELTGYAYRMLGSAFEAEDAVQETYIRAWRGYERFEGRAALRSWLYRIATNVCLAMLHGREGRARPMGPGPGRRPVVATARGADPVRGAAVDGGRGRGAARDERRVGQQRAAARAGDHRGDRHA